MLIKPKLPIEAALKLRKKAILKEKKKYNKKANKALIKKEVEVYV